MSLAPTKFLRMLIGAGLVLVLANMLLAVRYWNQLQQVRLASDDATETRRLAQQIKELSAEVPSEQTTVDEVSEIVSRIRSGLLQAGISEQSVGDIRPGTQVPVPKTDFTREDTSISLLNVAPLAVFNFIASAEAQDVGILCSGLVIDRSNKTPASNASTTEANMPEITWNIQMTLTHLRRGGKSLRRMVPTGQQALTLGFGAAYARSSRGSAPAQDIHGHPIFHRDPSHELSALGGEWMP